MFNAIGSGYGMYNKTVFNNYQQGAVTAAPPVKKISKETVQHTLRSTQQFSKEMARFLNDYKNQFGNLKNAAGHLNMCASECSLNQAQAGDNEEMPQLEQKPTRSITSGELRSDMQTVCAATENMAAAYNKTMQFMRDHGTKNGSNASQLQNFMLSGVSAQTMESVGLTFADDGTLNFQADVFDADTHQDGERTQKLFGNACQVAGRLCAACDRALTQPSNSLIQADQVKRDLQNLQEQRYDGTNLPAGVYTRNGSYGIMNASAMGMFLNVKA